MIVPLLFTGTVMPYRLAFHDFRIRGCFDGGWMYVSIGSLKEKKKKKKNLLEALSRRYRSRFFELDIYFTVQYSSYNF